MNKVKIFKMPKGQIYQGMWCADLRCCNKQTLHKFWFFGATLGYVLEHFRREHRPEFASEEIRIPVGSTYSHPMMGKFCMLDKNRVWQVRMMYGSFVPMRPCEDSHSVPYVEVYRS